MLALVLFVVLVLKGKEQHCFELLLLLSLSLLLVLVLVLVGKEQCWLWMMSPWQESAGTQGHHPLDGLATLDGGGSNLQVPLLMFSCELTPVYDRARLISHWLPLGHLDPSANVQGSWCSLCFNFLVGDSHRFLPNQKHGRIKESSVWWTACGQNCKHQRRMIKLRRESFFAD